MCMLLLFSTFFLFVVPLVGALLLRRYLAGPDLAPFDVPVVGQVGTRTEPSAGHREVVAGLKQLQKAGRTRGHKARIAAIRRFMDEEFGSPAADLDGVSVTSVDADGVAAEWVIPKQPNQSKPSDRPKSSVAQRRMLYIHGGGFVAGSPRSHRALVAELATRLDMAVLSIEYRLMPENPRMASVQDSRTAYRWLLGNGPAGPLGSDTEPELLVVAGDSAGGNLSLALSRWVSLPAQSELRQPDAVIAFSPATDGTFGSPSLISNRKSDPMLGKALSLAGRFRFGTMVSTWLYNRMLPRNPEISPVHGDLSGLPPTLVQVSEAEVLRDDARRYVNKAVAAGSPVTLQTWPHMVHVFQAFFERVEEGREAIEKVAQFVEDLERR